MKSLSIDIETYSSEDLSKCGVYRYAEAPDFEVLLFGYAVDGGMVQVVDLACGEMLPDEIVDALTDNAVTKWAFNAQFERICLSRWLHDIGKFSNGGYGSADEAVSAYLDPAGWRCTMVWASCMGLPLSLDAAGAALGLEKQKLEEGKELIRYFCKPCKPTKANGGRVRNRPEHDPGKWKLFKAYNARDVEVEMSIQQELWPFPVPEFVWSEYRLDQEINDRGVRIDTELAEQAIRMDSTAKEELTDRMQRLTGLENPRSVQQLTGWLAERGVVTESLDKKSVAALRDSGLPEELDEVLSLRQQVSRSSVKKYQTMQAAVCRDGRARGMFRFYGARTGRWAGRLIQLQNLPQNHLPDLAQARALVRAGDYEALQLLYEDVPDTLSQLVRTAFIPRDGCLFYVADFSAIEARVLAWLAGETWRQKVFEEGGDIYCASASQMFGVPVIKHGVNGHLRQKGKIAELALGYGGSVGALKAMGALEMGLDEDELPDLVSAWRGSNQNIIQFWWDVDDAAMRAVREKSGRQLGGLQFRCQNGLLAITLLSGREIAYRGAEIGKNRFDRDCITYMGYGRAGGWERLETYGPKLVENIVQATSRDILCCSMQRLSDRRITMHIHDELVIEAEPSASLEELCGIMGRTPAWADGLKLRADGYITPFYRKD